MQNSTVRCPKTFKHTTIASRRSLRGKALGCACLAAAALLPIPGKADGDVVLVSKGKPEAVIVVADTPLPTALMQLARTKNKEQYNSLYAATELQGFIEKATGAKLPIVAASEAPADGTLVLVGRSSLSDKLGLKTPKAPEGFNITVFPRGVAILGEVAPKGTDNLDYEFDRGTLHGVYEFLESIVGYRFFMHIKDDTDLGFVTPSRKDLSVPADYTLEMAPDFQFRSGGYVNWDIVELMRVTREGRGTGYPGAIHTDRHWSRFFKDHPEQAAVREDGTRDPIYMCYSEPSIIQTRMEVLETWYGDSDAKRIWYGEHGHPTSKYFTFVPADVFEWKGPCHCPRCTAARQDERGRFGKWSNLIFGHGVDIAKALHKRWPDKRVAMLAYESFMLPPEFDLPDTLDVQLCMMWSTTMGKADDYWHKRNLDLMREWSRKVGGKRERLYVWNYYCWPSEWTEAPIFFPHYLQKWFQDTYEMQNGEFINMGGNPPQFELLMVWLWHKLMWDRNADVDALVRDQCEQLYGPAGKAMEAFYKLVFDRYENTHWSREIDESYIPIDNLYGETYTAEAVAELKKLWAKVVAAAPKQPDNIYRRRVMWMQEPLLKFFDEADHAHKWLANPPSATVTDAPGAPSEGDWKKAEKLDLAMGNFGYKADLPASFSVIRGGGDIYVRSVSVQTNDLEKGDALALSFKTADGAELSARLVPGSNGLERAESKNPTNDLPVEILSSEVAKGYWTADMKFPASSIGLAPGQAAEVQANFERHRKAPRNEYAWMPKMRPPWDWPMRYGTLRIGVGR